MSPLNDRLEITVFRKSNGVLSKRISLNRNGKAKADGSACRMVEGTAVRQVLKDGVESLADLIDDLGSDEALALGRLRPGLSDKLKVIRKRKLNKQTPRDTVARTGEYLIFPPGKPAVMLLDHDCKNMPGEIATKLSGAGGFWSVLTSVIPEFADAECLHRRSTSSGLYNKKTNKKLPGSASKHVYVEIKDGADIERALKTLHDLLWLEGYGYYVVGKAGQLLDRSIIDASVYGAERLVFEGRPTLQWPMGQDQEVRRPEVYRGKRVNTARAISPLTVSEARRLADLKADAAHRLKPAADEARKIWAREYAEQHGLAEQEAERIATQAANHILESEFVLDFDDPELGICTVGEVLAEPDKYVGETLADPLEGVAYGRDKARVYRQSDGRLMINSFAHGGIKYRLADQGVGLNDFYAYMEKHTYIFTPTRLPWPAISVNARIPPLPLLDADKQPILDKNGKPKTIQANAWLDRNRPVEQITWAPGLPMVVRNKLILEGGWITRNAVSVLNLYRPPEIKHGDPSKAGRWVDHVRKVYPDGADHIITWLAQRVQRPDVKINHALVLGGAQGIGKDTMLVPIKQAVGPWNFQDINPEQAMGRFNGFLKSVILRIDEARDLAGRFDRFAFYEHMKIYTAEPPEVLRVDEKNLREHNILNVCGVIFTTNHKTNGIHLERDDRRHYVAWSDLTKTDFDEYYFKKLYRWFESGGSDHVAAYLAKLDISAFNAKAPPLQTPAFWAIVDAGDAPEDAEFADAIDALAAEAAGGGAPDALTLVDIIGVTESESFKEWLNERRNSRQIPYRMEAAGYVQVRNSSREDGRWKIAGQRRVIYAKKTLSQQEQQRAASALAGRGSGRESNILRPVFGQRRREIRNRTED
jgi:hypothetical protein